MPDYSRLTKPQIAFLVRAHERPDRRYNGRAREMVDRLAKNGLLTYELDPVYAGRGGRYMWRITVSLTEAGRQVAQAHTPRQEATR